MPPKLRVAESIQTPDVDFLWNARICIELRDDAKVHLPFLRFGFRSEKSDSVAPVRSLEDFYHPGAMPDFDVAGA